MSLKIIGITLILAIASYVAPKLIDIHNKKKGDAWQAKLALASKMEGGTYFNPITKQPMPYRLYTPKQYNDDNTKQHPIILVLHSGAGRGTDNVNQLEHIAQVLTSDTLQSLEPTFILAPQAKKRSHWVDYDTFTPPFTNFDQNIIPQSENLKTAVMLLKQTIADYRIDQQKIFIIGFSMGGEGTWDAVTYYPDLFTAAIVMCGAGDPNAISRVGMMPIRYFHGKNDTITPVENSRALKESFKFFPNNAIYKEFPQLGHGIPQTVLTPTLLKWLLKQDKSRFQNSN